jgi:energy-coupling factor transport system permease protein
VVWRGVWCGGGPGRALPPPPTTLAMLATWSYHLRNSLMESFDPRARWIFSFAFLLSVTMFWDARLLAVFFILAMLWYATGRTSFRETRRAWIFVSITLFSMIIINTILTGGGAGGIVPPGGHLVFPGGFSFSILGWTPHFGLTYERMWFALCQLLRIISISAIFIIIPFTMDPRVYGVTFRGLGFPDRFAYAMELAFRYVPTVARDFNTTFDAQRARGYEIERVDGGLVKQLLRVAPLLVPVTMNAILMGEDVVNAMDLRCFGQRPRTWLTKLTYRWRDYVLLAFSVLMLVSSLVLKNVVGVGDFWIPPFIAGM